MNDLFTPEDIEIAARAYASAWKADIKKFLGTDVCSWDELGNSQKDAMRRCARVGLAAVAPRLAERAAPAWRPIESAPKDGTLILAFGRAAGAISGIFPEDGILVICWTDDLTDYPGFEWSVAGTNCYATWMKPTHWMPLPAAPKPVP